MSKTTFQIVAEEFTNAFETRFKPARESSVDHEEYTTLKEGSSQWMIDAVCACHKALGDRMPDDWIYENAWAAAINLAEHEDHDSALDAWSDIAGNCLDLSTHDLLQWLASHLGNIGLCDEALDEGKVDKDATMYDRIVAGQHYALESIAMILANEINAEAETRDESDEESVAQ